MTSDPRTNRWITFSRIHHPKLGWLLVQKRDGSSRTISEKQAKLDTKKETS